MSPLLFGPIADLLKEIIAKIWPDPAKQQEAAQALIRLNQAGELAQLDADLKLALAQANINNTEAASGNGFASNWRPAVGWVCVSALGYQYIVWGLLTWLCSLAHAAVPPKLELADILGLLPALLGFGAYRSYDKVKGTVQE